MKLYYTGALAYNTAQKSADKSIGGLMSSSVIPNASLNNIFSELSASTLKPDTFEVSGVILKNESGGPLTDIKFYFDANLTTDLCKYEIAIVAVSINAKGEVSIEKLESPHSVPYSADFASAETIDNALIVASLANNAMVGIWLKRLIDNDKIANYFSDDAVLARYEAGTASIINEKMNLSIEW